MSEISQLYEEVKPSLLSEDSIYTIVLIDTGGRTHRYEEAISLNDPFCFDVSKLMPNTKVMDLPRFYSVAAQLIDDAQAREGILEEDRVQLVQEYQPERFHTLGDEVITAKVKSRKPANMNSKGTGTPQRGSSRSHSMRSVNHPNKEIIIETRPIDHDIEFAVWAKTSTLANARALWLEKLFITNTWAFTVQGVDRFFWIKRGADTLWTGSGQRLHHRPLEFFVRLREAEIYAHPILRQIDFEVRV